MNGRNWSLGGIWRACTTGNLQVVFGSFHCWLLVFVPLALLANKLDLGDALVFCTALLAIPVVAERLSYVTDVLAAYSNDTVGGLLMSTFGNLTELMFAGFALKAGLVRVVQLSLLGSVLTNLLLILGSGFLIGGYKHFQQSFKMPGVTINLGLLVVSSAAVLLPSTLQATKSETYTTADLDFSRVESIFLLVAYCLLLVFQLVTHAKLFSGASEEAERCTTPAMCDSSTTDQDAQPMSLEDSVHAKRDAQSKSTTKDEEAGSGFKIKSEGGSSLDDCVPISSTPVPFTDSLKVIAAAPTPATDENSNEEVPKVMSVLVCVVWLALLTLIITLLSNILTAAIKGASRQMEIPLPFLATVIIPVIGNSCEHISAIIFSWKNRMDVTISIALGSAAQISFLVLPLCVVTAWCMGLPLSLNFGVYESLTLFISVLLVGSLLQDAASNWMKGIVLILGYCFIALAYWYHANPAISFDDI